MKTLNFKTKPARTIFDPLYGFIKLTETEARIIQSPYYQRLRWIKQLGFSSYLFPGAEHNRFAHAIGVMHIADKILQAIGYAVPPEKLFDTKSNDPASTFHKNIRIAALLHDIGTFPFSHTCEGAYIQHGSTASRGKSYPNNHEHLGAYILKNSKEPGGITQILEETELDYQEISTIIKGESDNLLANQVLHSEVDADRMDYLMRDAHYTGIKYGHIDHDYILYHMVAFDSGDGNKSLGVRDNAMHAVEDFLIARFGWYSQIVRGSAGARFDIIGETITKYFLETKKIWQFEDLLEMVGKEPDHFFGFNDFYFMGLLHKEYINDSIKDPKIKEMAKMLLYRISPRRITIPPFEQQLFARDKDGIGERKKMEQKIRSLVQDFENIIQKKGVGTEWLLYDIPKSDIVFATHRNDILNGKTKNNILQERDPVKILDYRGKASLLVDRQHSIVRILSNIQNFIPSLYMNESAYSLLKNECAFQSTFSTGS